MDYSAASECVKLNYRSQYNLLLNSLCQDAIITLSDLCDQRMQRELSNETIKKLSLMEPHQQCGYITNPLLQYMIDSYISSVINTSGSTTKSNTSITIDTTIKPDNKPKPEPPKPAPKPEPEPEEDIAPLFDLFA